MRNCTLLPGALANGAKNKISQGEDCGSHQSPHQHMAGRGRRRRSEKSSKKPKDPFQDSIFQAVQPGRPVDLMKFAACENLIESGSWDFRVRWRLGESVGFFCELVQSRCQ